METHSGRMSSCLPATKDFTRSIALCLLSVSRCSADTHLVRPPRAVSNRHTARIDNHNHVQKGKWRMSATRAFVRKLSLFVYTLQKWRPAILCTCPEANIRTLSVPGCQNHTHSSTIALNPGHET